jgi:magnesium-transporting ATPase (P-type)
VDASSTGLTSQEAAARLVRDGPNLLPRPARPSGWTALGRQFTHLLALLLWVAAGFALLAGMPSLAVAIVAVVVINAVFAFWQEYRADRSTERLLSLLPTTVRVRRDDAPRTIDASELVVGDLVLLGSGDRIAADLRLLTAHEVSVDESLVTGESRPVRHRAGDALMAGTFAVQGVGEAVVTAVGAGTTLAGISALARSAVRPASPLTVQLGRVVRAVAVVATATGAALGVGGLLLGLAPAQAFLFGVGVAVALVPEGLLPTVTLSLARGAQVMAGRKALVRRLDAVETLGATTFICTDKTGTLTENRMEVVEVWTPEGAVRVVGAGYAPEARFEGSADSEARVAPIAASAVLCVQGRVVPRDDEWAAEGDPMEAAIHCLALRCGWGPPRRPVESMQPYTADRMLSSVVHEGQVHVLGAPERVMDRCTGTPQEAVEALHAMTGRAQRVVAVATRRYAPGMTAEQRESGLELAGLLGIEDPPRPDVAASLEACRGARIRVAMVTGDHPRTAEAIAREVGLFTGPGVVLDGSALPADDEELGELLDHPEGAVVARVAPAGKLRIARVLRDRGHVVAMTGDGVNDAPALREADVGVAMGAGGSDVAREASDLVLLDDHFGTIVAAVALGRATFANVRRFLTYHLTDNVAELAPFAAWALTGGHFPLAIGVLQVLALDIGTDMLPALALGAEPPSPRVMAGRLRSRDLVDRQLLTRAFGVLGPTEAVVSLTAFTLVLLAGGWAWGETPGPALLASASGTTFAAIALAQMANAVACRSETVAAWRMRPLGNPLLLAAVAAELVLLVAFVGVPALARLLGGSWPPPAGWAWGLAGGAVLLLVDAVHKRVRVRGRRGHRSRRQGAR